MLFSEYKNIRMHVEDDNKTCGCFFQSGLYLGGSICILVAGAFDMRVMSMTNGILVRKLVPACWPQLIHCYYSDIPEGTIHISF